MKRKKRPIALLLASLAFLLCAAVAGAAGGTPSVVLRARDGVVRVFSYQEDGFFTGTGFALSNNSSGAMILTNYHVVDGCSAYELYYDGNGPVALEIVAVSEVQDLCVLRTAHKLKGLKPLTLANGVSSGEAVYTLGYPGGADDLSLQMALTKEKMTVSNGIVSAIQDSNLVGNYMRPVKLVQTNADINHGNSGGPMLNEKGQVVGVNTLTMNDFSVSGINGAVHVDEVRSFLDVQGIRYQTSSALVWEIAAIAAVLAALVLAAFLLRRKKQKALRRQAALPAGAADSAGWSAAAGPARPAGPEGTGSPAAAAGQSEFFSAAQPVREIEEKEIDGQISLFDDPAPEATLPPTAASAADDLSAEGKETARKKGGRRGFLAAAALALVLLAVGGFGFYTWDVYTDIESAWGYQNYEQVAACYRRVPWVELFCGAEPRRYSEAMLKAQAHEMEDAVALLEELGDYGDAKEQIELAQSYQKVLSIPATNLVGRYKGYRDLGNYLDCPQNAELLLAEIYNKVVERLSTGNMGGNKAYLEVLPNDYRDIAVYKEFASAYERLLSHPSSDTCLSFCYRCEALGFQLPIGIQNGYLDYFLYGRWESSTGWYFELDEKYYDTNIEEISGSIFIRQNVIHIDGKSVFATVNILDGDHITMICEGRSYSMTRK